MAVDPERIRLARERLKNEASKRALDVPLIADIYWRKQERQRPLAGRLARAAMRVPAVRDFYWEYREQLARQAKSTEPSEPDARQPVIFRL